MAAKSLDNIYTILKNANIKYKVEKKEYDIYNPDLIPNDTSVKLYINRRAFRKYESYHSESILCILQRKNKDLLVIYKNREYVSLDSTIKHWYHSENLTSKECNVCYSEDIKDFTRCVHCDYLMCTNCLEKIKKSEQAFKCPSCRQWELLGYTFGIPWNQVRYELNSDINDPVDCLFDLLDKFDGMIKIIPIVDSFMIFKDISMCKLAFTKRYKKKYFKAKRCLKQIINDFDEGLILSFYVIRYTYAIDKNEDKPIVEMSRFQVRDKHLISCHSDLWVQVLKDDPYKIYKKVYYVEPYKFVLPKPFYDLFNLINRKYKSYKIYSVFHEDFGGVCFDIDANGSLIVGEDFEKTPILSIIDAMVLKFESLFVACRIIPDEEDDVADYIAYKINKDGYYKLSAIYSKTICEKDCDSLYDVKHIRHYL